MRGGEFTCIISILTKNNVFFRFVYLEQEYRKNTDIDNNALKVPISVV